MGGEAPPGEGQPHKRLWTQGPGPAGWSVWLGSRQPRQLQQLPNWASPAACTSSFGALTTLDKTVVQRFILSAQLTARIVSDLSCAVPQGLTRCPENKRMHVCPSPPPTPILLIPPRALFT